MGILDPAQGQSNFNILGMLLGGRSYASNWLGQRDAINQQAAERQRIGAAASGLLQTPEYKAAVTDPQAQAQFNLWAKMQPDFSGMGNNLLSQKVGALYQKEATKFSDQLDRERMGISLDNQMKMDQVQRDRNLADQKAQFGLIAQLPNAMRNAAYADKMFGYKPPADYIIDSFDQNGAPNLKLQANSPTGMKAIEEIQPLKNVGESMAMLSDMASGKATFDQGLWNATRTNLVMEMKAAEKLGSYDEGLKNFIDSAVPDKGMFTTDWLGTKKTQLEMYSKLYAARAQATAGKWGIPIEDVPSVLKISGLKPTSAPPTEAPPGYGNDNKPAANAVAPQRWDRGKPQAAQPGTGLLDTPGGQPARTRAWR